MVLMVFVMYNDIRRSLLLMKSIKPDAGKDGGKTFCLFPASAFYNYCSSAMRDTPTLDLGYFCTRSCNPRFRSGAGRI